MLMRQASSISDSREDSFLILVHHLRAIPAWSCGKPPRTGSG